MKQSNLTGGFQLTAARRRLGSGRQYPQDFARYFNSQPREGGWAKSPAHYRAAKISTHSRAKAAGSLMILKGFLSFDFNSQPREGGWGGWVRDKGRKEISTHSRAKAAGPLPLSHTSHTSNFNSQPREGGWWLPALQHDKHNAHFNSQPREGGWHRVTDSSAATQNFNSQPREGGWNSISADKTA